MTKKEIKQYEPRPVFKLPTKSCRSLQILPLRHPIYFYKAVNDQPIAINLLIPKDASLGKHPLLVRFHGGALFTGSSLTPTYFAQWNIDYAITHAAILVTPDYRLLPESTGQDIIDDLSDIWKWVQNDLQPFVSKHTHDQIIVDLSKILTQGESAGSYLAIQSSLALDPPPPISAIISAYPTLDFQFPWFTQPHPAPSPELSVPLSTLTDYLAALPLGKIVSTADPVADPPLRRNLLLAVFQHGKYYDLLRGTGNDAPRSLFPMQLVEDMRLKETGFPALFIYHGKEDRIVPVEGTEKFIRKLRECLPEGKVVMKIEEGDHEFDYPLKYKVDGGVEWLRGAGARHARVVGVERRRWGWQRVIWVNYRPSFSP